MRTSSFRHEGHRLAYSDYGGKGRTLVLLPGLLTPRRMHEPLATRLSDSGIRVVTLDFLGHGESDRPYDPTLYSVPKFADQSLALLDHLGLDTCIVGGTSLGANVTLEVAARHPERLKGMILEMPVLDNAILASIMAFAPLLIGLELGGNSARLLARGIGKVPRVALPFYPGLLLEILSQDPSACAAVVKGLFFDRVAPPSNIRKTIRTKALVVGHHRDPIHPFADAGMLVKELPNATSLEAASIFVMRMFPDRMRDAVTEFVTASWPRVSSRTARTSKNRAS